MFFKLINAPVTLQRVINKTLYYFFDKTIIIYINYIFIYSENLLEYKKHVSKVLNCL